MLSPAGATGERLSHSLAESLRHAARRRCDADGAATLFAKYSDLKTDGMGKCPDWQDPRTANLSINRVTRGWNAAASHFAYGCASALPFGVVARDQSHARVASLGRTGTAASRLSATSRSPMMTWRAACGPTTSRPSPASTGSQGSPTPSFG